MNEQNNIREELLKLADLKEIKYSVTYIKKASEKTLEKIYKDYQRSQLNETNEMLTDTIIGKFSELAKHLDLIDNSTELGKELSENKLFRNDIKIILEYVTPFIPLVGVLSGGLITAKHVFNKKMNNKEEQKSENNINNNEEQKNENILNKIECQTKESQIQIEEN